GLSAGCDVFHYAGHTDVSGGRGTPTPRGDNARPSTHPGAAGPPTKLMDKLEAVEQPAPRAAREVLAARLTRAGTRLAVFNACNSGLWPFVRPLMRAGVPAVIGVQGLISNLAALNFAEMFYKALAVGLSLDEALTYARLYVIEPERSHYPCDWGRFMAYMPVESAVLFPRPAGEQIRKHQDAIRAGRQHTIDNLP